MTGEQQQVSSEAGCLYEWQEACYAAIYEMDEAKIPERLSRASEALEHRLSGLEPWPDGREMVLLHEAVQSLRELQDRYTS